MEDLDRLVWRDVGVGEGAGQCLQWAETAADRTKVRTECGEQQKPAACPQNKRKESKGALQIRTGLQSQQKVSGRLPATPRYTFKSGDGRDLPKEMFIMGAEWLPHHCLQWCATVAASSVDTSGLGTLGQ